MATIDPKTGLPITDVSNAAIPTSALSTPQTPIKVASVADQTPIYNAGITSGAGVVQSGLDLAQKQADELAAQNKYVEGSNTLSALQSQVSGKAADQASAYAQTGGVNDLYKQLSQLNVEAQGLQRQTLANPLQQQEAAIGTGRVQGQVEQITAQNQRQIALKALDLGQRAAIAQGNYDVAKNLADQQIEAKYAGLTAQIEAQKTNLAALDKIVLTPAQEKRKEAANALLKKQEQEIADKKANDKAINDMIIQASPVAPSDVLARAKAIQQKGGSATDVAMSLGQYGGDYYKTALLKEQIATEKAQRAKIYADMREKTTGATTGAVTTANDLQSATANLKLNEGQSKALAFGQRAINADKALRERLQTYDPTTIFSAGGRLLETDNARAFKRDMQDFITAVLRKESGATITEDEFNRFIPIYSPQGIMTNQKDVEQTNTKRSAAIDALISEAGPASAALSAYKKSVGTITPVNVPNKFNSALGNSSTPIMGTQIINKVGDDGSIEFNIPVK